MVNNKFITDDQIFEGPVPFRLHPMFQKTFFWLILFLFVPGFIILLELSVFSFLDGIFKLISDRTVALIFFSTLIGLSFYYSVVILLGIKHLIEIYIFKKGEEKL